MLNSSKGMLEVICGPMFSGKTEELIKRLKRAEFAQLKVIAFKHKIDNRMTIECINAHNGDKFKAIALDNPEDIRLFVGQETDIDIIAIDEVQFFPSTIISVLLELVDNKKRVIVSGLDLDFRGMPFGCISQLLTFADYVTKLKAVCVKCGQDAHFTQRLIDDKIAKFDDPVIIVGAQEKYQSRCRACFILDNKYWTEIKRL